MKTSTSKTKILGFQRSSSYLQSNLYQPLYTCFAIGLVSIVLLVSKNQNDKQDTNLGMYTTICNFIIIIIFFILFVDIRPCYCYRNQTIICLIYDYQMVVVNYNGSQTLFARKIRFKFTESVKLYFKKTQKNCQFFADLASEL